MEKTKTSISLDKDVYDKIKSSGQRGQKFQSASQSHTQRAPR